MKWQKVLIVSMVLLSVCFAYGNNKTDSLVKALDIAISQKRKYDIAKQEKINALKLLRDKTTDVQNIYNINEQLYTEYRKFQVDSAITYVQYNILLAKQLPNSNYYYKALIQLANLYSTTGKYLESSSILNSIPKQQLNTAVTALYYQMWLHFYEHYLTHSNNQLYVVNIHAYRDSLLQVLPTNSVDFKINKVQQWLGNKQWQKAGVVLDSLLQTNTETTSTYAMLNYLSANRYAQEGNKVKQKQYFMVAAITDIKNALKDNAAIQNLALIFYDEGAVDRAYTYTKSAVDDALFCNVKFRTIQVSELFSIINKAYVEKEVKQKAQLKTYLLCISILTLVLVLTVVYIYFQYKKLKRVKESLFTTNARLEELNTNIEATNKELEARNLQLWEANIIKEEYIAQFFDMCSSYINKLENYRLMLNKKAITKEHKELFKILKSNSIVEEEVKHLYKSFDTIFLNLYPNFITEFNALLLPEEQVELKNDELLNTELRIFALVRLGISDSVKIAAFLRYSLSTIYNYRTKTRNKAAVSRDEFEKLIMYIGSGKK